MEAVQSIRFKTSKGELREFKVLSHRKADKDSKANVIIKDADGKESIYTKELIRNKDGNEGYVYVLCDRGKAVTSPRKALPKGKNYFWSWGDCGWNRDVDKFFDNCLSIDNSKATTDGKDDGHVTFKEGAKHFFKGMLSPFKAIIKSPIKSIITAVAVGALCVAFPPLGVGLAAAGLAMGIGTAAYGGIKAAAAKTDGEAKAAWENVGTGTMTAILSAIGLAKAKKGLNLRKTAGETPAPAPASAPDAPPTPPPSGEYEYSGLAKLAVKTADGVKNVADTVATSAKEMAHTVRHPIQSLKQYDVPGTYADKLQSNGFGEYANWKITQLGRHRIGLTVDGCKSDIISNVQAGNHWKAHTALSELRHLVKTSNLEGDALTSAKAVLSDCSKLVDGTRYVNKFPVYRATAVGAGLVENATDGSATELADIAKDAFQFVS